MLSYMDDVPEWMLSYMDAMSDWMFLLWMPCLTDVVFYGCRA